MSGEEQANLLQEWKALGLGTVDKDKDKDEDEGKDGAKESGDGAVDLNKASDVELAAAKAEMSTGFEASKIANRQQCFAISVNFASSF